VPFSFNLNISLKALNVFRTQRRSFSSLNGWEDSVKMSKIELLEELKKLAKIDLPNLLSNNSLYYSLCPAVKGQWICQ